LQMHQIAKNYGGVQALRGVDLDLYEGEVHGVVGENGAGKSTLMRILAGATQPDAGSLELDGQPIVFPSPAAAQAAGIALLHQELMLVPTLTVAENVALGHMPGGRVLVDRRAMASLARELLDWLGMELDPWREVRTLSVAQRQMVAVARALSLKARIIILDEPTAVLSQAEVEHLFSVVEQLRQEGKALIYVSHRLEEVFRLADRVTVLRDGERMGTFPTSELDRDKLISLMVGRAWQRERQRSTTPGTRALLQVRDISDGHGVGPCSFELREREVLGLAGLVGSGRSELAHMIIGARRRASGEVLLKGQPFAPRLPRQCLGAGVAYVPEDRQVQGLFAVLSVTDNLLLPLYHGAMAGPLISLRRASARVRELAQRLDLRPADPGLAVRALSGGNQQKVVLGRWLNLAPEVFLLDEPTRGIDVGAKAAVHDLIRELADAGAGVLLISSDLPELLSLSDRVLAMREGRIVAELTREEADEETVLSHILGARTDHGC